MIEKSLAGFVISALATAWAADLFQPLNIKPGLWQITLAVRTSGAPPIPADVLAKLTPEQRARIAAQPTDKPEPPRISAKQSCLAEQELRQPLTLGFTDLQGCRQTVVVSSPGRQEIRVDCGNGESAGGGDIQIEASDPRNAKVSSKWSATDGSRDVKMSSIATLKWLAADCRPEAPPAAKSAPPVPVPPAKPSAPPPAPADAASNYKLGKEQVDRGEFEQAQRSLSRAVEQDPRNALFYNARGYAYLRLRNLNAAIQDFSEAIRLRPDYLNAYQNRAIANRRAGRESDAAADERKTAELKSR